MSPQSDGDHSTLERAFTIVLGVVFLAAVVGVVYTALVPAQSSASYTEFYVLGENNSAANYPTDLTVGETGTLTVGVSSQEPSETRYTVLVLLDGNEQTRQTVTLESGETWTDEISVTPSQAGRQKLRLLLFEGDAGAPSDSQQSLRIWINATQAAT